LILNVNIFGPRIALHANCHRRRQERILNALTLLLWIAEDLDSQMYIQVLKQLPSPSTMTGSPWMRTNQSGAGSINLAEDLACSAPSHFEKFSAY